jgi:hypothetical protein
MPTFNADVAANRWRALITNDNVRKAIGRGGAQTMADGKEQEKKRGRPRKEKENGGEGDTGTKKGGFTGEDLIIVACAVTDANPYIASGQAWQQVVDALRAQDFRHTTISAASVQHKAEALISYKKV